MEEKDSLEDDVADGVRRYILDTVSDLVTDLVTDFMDCARREDKELPRGCIECAIEDELVTVDEIVAKFREELERNLVAQEG